MVKKSCSAVGRTMMWLELHNYNADKENENERTMASTLWEKSKGWKLYCEGGTVHVKLDLKGIHQAPFLPSMRG